jgi:hypothetical protein
MGWAFQGVVWGSHFGQRLALWGQPADPALKSVIVTVHYACHSGQAVDPISQQAPQLAAMIVETHHRTTGVPGQGVDCRLLSLVINSPAPSPPPGGVFRDQVVAAA